MTDAVQAVGHIIQGVGGYVAGQQNKRALYQQAGEEEQAGVAAETRIRETARAEIGQQVAAQFSNGMMGGTGSALDSLTQSQINAALDALNVRRDTAAKAKALRQQGKMASTAGKFALAAGLFQAGSSVANNSSDWAAARTGTSRPQPQSAPGGG